MEAASAGFNSLEVVFLICAICGGIVVAFRFVMMFIGGDVDTHGDMELDLDIDSATGDVDFSDISDIS
ncbi:MAG: hypothetical protein GWN61_17320, partial [candidate division Zixibacteria bacterium]|nr:hypothetical protein [candidate division Zixibacteria bacterium]NIR65988.1 hypothetical protein [candidate division Zixibacteria bacterium]NIS47631.1 hypothetical protein [candidate division Zixibacteria bacterium]NIU15723.1 hypothetical protein [candidate division Zixibacteria bacterium]NIV07882.1 hypothetical protein [candidate division Zixibacteria bacterium]